MPRQAYLFNGVPTRLRSRITETGSPQILSYSEFHHIIGAAFFMSYNESRQASRDVSHGRRFFVSSVYVVWGRCRGRPWFVQLCIRKRAGRPLWNTSCPLAVCAAFVPVAIIPTRWSKAVLRRCRSKRGLRLSPY